MSWGKIGGLAVVLMGGLWLESRLTGTAFNLNLLNPVKSVLATPPAGAATSGPPKTASHPSAQAGAGG